MNSKTLFAAVFITILATGAAFSFPSAATSIGSNVAAQRAPGTITIPPTMKYEIDGSLFAWANVTGYALVTITLSNGTAINMNITIREMYLALLITLTCKNITVDSVTGAGSAQVAVTARIVGAIDMYAEYGGENQSVIQNIDQSYGNTWEAKYFVPWGNTKNFTIPFGLIGPSVSGDPTDLRINFTPDNITSDSVQYNSVRHVSWDFGGWMENKVKGVLNELVGSQIEQIETMVPGLQVGSSIPTSVGKADLWFANATVGATEVPNVLLMAGAAINFVLDYYVVGRGRVSYPSVGTVDYNVDERAEFGVMFALSVTSDYFRTNNLVGDNKINTFDILVPENGTFVPRRVSVIIYYGSPAHGIDVTGGTSRGYASYPSPSEDKLFFVDYGYDGAPDFATNGTGQPIQLTDHTGTIAGTGNTRTVTLSKLSAGDWVYFKLTVPAGYRVSSVERNDGSTTTTVNATQWYTTGGVLYVCDDPAYSYTVTLTPLAGGFPTTIVLIGAVAVVALVAAFVVVRRRRSSSTVVSIK